MQTTKKGEGGIAVRIDTADDSDKIGIVANKYIFKILDIDYSYF